MIKSGVLTILRFDIHLDSFILQDGYFERGVQRVSNSLAYISINQVISECVHADIINITIISIYS